MMTDPRKSICRVHWTGGIVSKVSGQTTGSDAMLVIQTRVRKTATVLRVSEADKSVNALYFVCLIRSQRPDKPDVCYVNRCADWADGSRQIHRTDVRADG